MKKNWDKRHRTILIISALVILTISLGLVVFKKLGVKAAGNIERVSVASDGSQANYPSENRPSISADGRYVAFDSWASNLVPGDTNAELDIFVHDRQTDTTELVSIASDGSNGSGRSFAPSISADGRYVVFHSDASNLVPNDTNGVKDVFVHDRQSGTTERVSIASDGIQGNGQSYHASISADGHYVAFTSGATNLVTGDTNGYEDIFIHDRQTSITQRVSIASDGIQANSFSYFPSVSADGRYIAFVTRATNLVSSDTNGQVTDIFVHDRQTSITQLVSVASDGNQGNGWSDTPILSADGRYVAFWSDSSNLVPNDTNGYADIFVRDRQTGATERVSIASDGTQANEPSRNFSSHFISADGRYVAFHSDASNLVPNDTNGYEDIFVHNRQTGATERVSIASDGTQADFASVYPTLSADGRFVTFKSGASNLVPSDTNGYEDIFVTLNPVLYNTPAGSNITYNEKGVVITFPNVTSPGDTTITSSSSGNQPPTGFRLGSPPTYYNISTTATFSGNVEVCIDYSSLTIQGNENNLKLMHFDSALGWVNITSSLDTANNIICGITTSFSDFAVMTAPTIQDLINRVQEMNLQQGIENSLDAKLTAGQDALNANNSGQTETVINKLNSFINEVEAQRGNKLTNSRADELHSFATNLISLIQGTAQFSS